MSTSGSISYSLTAKQVVTYALRNLLGVVDSIIEPSAEDERDGLTALNLMLKGWQINGPHLWQQTDGTATLVASTASYTLTPKPYRVIEARYRDANGRDLPMFELTRQEYLEMPVKNSLGVPTSYYVDYQRGSTVMYVWPVLAAVTSETVVYTYQRAIEDVAEPTNDLDIPQEWLETVAYCLADRLSDTFTTDRATRISQRAAMFLAQAQDMDREAVVRFEPERC